MKALVFAAGLGTRLKPITDSVPKALVEVGGKTLLERLLLKLAADGFDDVVVNVHHFSKQIMDFIAADKRFRKVRISDETSMLLDTGGGLRRAVSLFAVDDDAPILIHNVDILSNLDLASFYEANKMHDVTLLVSERKTSRYLLVKDGRLVGWTNIDTGEVRTPYVGLDLDACRKLAFSGIHLFSPRLSTLLDGYPEKFPIMDFYLTQCHRINIHCELKEDLQMVDVGKLSTLQAAEEFCSLSRS